MIKTNVPVKARAMIVTETPLARTPPAVLTVLVTRVTKVTAKQGEPAAVTLTIVSVLIVGRVRVWTR